MVIFFSVIDFFVLNNLLLIIFVSCFKLFSSVIIVVIFYEIYICFIIFVWSRCIFVDI